MCGYVNLADFRKTVGRRCPEVETSSLYNRVVSPPFNSKLRWCHYMILTERESNKMILNANEMWNNLSLYKTKLGELNW